MVTRRGFLKVAPLGLKTAPQQAAETIVKPIKNTVKAARNYDGVVRKVKKNGTLLSTRRNFLDRVKVNGGVLLMRNPKETTQLLGSGRKMLTSSLANLDPMTVAEKTSRIAVPGWLGWLKNFKEDLYYLCDF
jgi:hypothetical protein